MNILDTVWRTESGDFIEFRSNQLVKSKYGGGFSPDNWNLDLDNIINFNIQDQIFKANIQDDSMEGFSTLYGERKEFKAKRLDKVRQFYLESLPYSKWVLNNADEFGNNIKFQFDEYFGIIGEFSSWETNDYNQITIWYNRYNITYSGTIKKNIISGFATNKLGNTWVFEAIRISSNLIKKAEYKLKRNQFLEANKLYKFHYNYFGFNPLTSNSKHLDNYLISCLKINNPGITLDSNSLTYKKLQSDLIKYRAKLREQNKLTVFFFNSYGIYIYDYDNIINFSNHKGKSIKELVEVNPNFLMWSILNLDRFALAPHIFLHPKLEKEENFLKALEHNLVKIKLKSVFISDFEENEDVEDESYKNYSWGEAYEDGGGSDEWSDPTEYW